MLGQHKRFVGFGALAVCVTTGSAAAAPVFTGDASFDFVGPGAIEVRDGLAEDVGLPVPPFASTSVSGYDIRSLHLWWDEVTDELHVGIESFGVCLDADGDGDPDATSLELSAMLGVDEINGAATESVSVFFDLDEDGTYDVIVGVSGDDDFSTFGVYEFAGVPFAPPFAFGDEIPGRLAGPFAVPSVSAPDLEFTISDFSTFSTSSGGDTGPNFVVAAYMGSYSDDGIAEDFMDGDIVSFSDCGDGFVTSEEECDDGNLWNGDGCDDVCALEPLPECVYSKGQWRALPTWPVIGRQLMLCEGTAESIVDAPPSHCNLATRAPRARGEGAVHPRACCAFSTRCWWPSRTPCST